MPFSVKSSKISYLCPVFPMFLSRLARKTACPAFEAFSGQKPAVCDCASFLKHVRRAKCPLSVCVQHHFLEKPYTWKVDKLIWWLLSWIYTSGKEGLRCAYLPLWMVQKMPTGTKQSPLLSSGHFASTEQGRYRKSSLGWNLEQCFQKISCTNWTRLCHHGGAVSLKTFHRGWGHCVRLRYRSRGPLVCSYRNSKDAFDEKPSARRWGRSCCTPSSISLILVFISQKLLEQQGVIRGFLSTQFKICRAYWKNMSSRFLWPSQCSNIFLFFTAIPCGPLWKWNVASH